MNELRVQSGLLTEDHALRSRSRVDVDKVVGEELHPAGIPDVAAIELVAVKPLSTGTHSL